MKPRTHVCACILGLAWASRLAGATPEEAERLFAAHRYAEARMAFEEVAAADPRNAEAAYRLGLLALMRNEPSEAVTRFEKATQLAPESSRYFQGLGDAYGVSAEHGGLFTQLAMARRCRTAYQKAVTLDPRSVPARYALFSFYRQAPGIAGGSLEKAREQGLEIRKLDAVRGTIALVEVSVVEKKYTEAFAELFKLRQSHPDALEVPYQIGRTAAMSGMELDSGEAALKAYLTHSPGEDQAPLWAAHWRLGQIHERRGDRASARSEFEAALKLNPTQPQLLEAMKRVK